jgi:hypothetical protein
MICKRCGKEIDERKTFIADMHMGRVIGYAHTKCWNKAYNITAGKKEEEDLE